MELSGTGGLGEGAGVRMQRAGRPGEKMEERAWAGGVCVHGMSVLGLPQRWPPPCVQRTAPGGLMAARCHMAAEEELEGAVGQEWKVLGG